MEREFPRDWMWSEAFVMLALVECLYREIFRPGCSLSRLKTAGAALILVALPGVNSDQVGATILASEASDFFLPTNTVASGGRWPMAAL